MLEPVLNFKWCSSTDSSNFVILDNNVFSLYEIVEGKNRELNDRDIELSPTCAAIEIASKPGDDRRKYKSFIVNPDEHEFKTVVASYQQKLYKIDLSKDECEDVLNLNTEKRQSVKRYIHLLDWDTIHTNRIALTIDKFRNLRSIYIIDINAKRIIHELGNEGEGIKSMKWSPHKSDELAVGTSKKRLEIFDLRAPLGKESCQRTNDILEIEGICFSPKYERILATHSEEYIKLWDIRYLKSTTPVYQEKIISGDISKIEWCPTHPTRLSYITKSAKYIHILDFPSNTLENSDMDLNDTLTPDQSTRHRQKGAPEMSGAYITNFSWHPTLQNRILCSKQFIDSASNNNSKLYDISLYETIIAKFVPSNDLVWGCANTLVTCTMPGGDIADITEKRILQGYGFNPSSNRYITRDNPSLYAFWKFFESVQAKEGHVEHTNKEASRSHSTKELNVRQSDDFKMGAQYLINSGVRESSSAHNMELEPRVRYYKSTARNKVLEICGWPHSTVGRIDIRHIPIIDKLYQSGEYNKSAAMTLFYLGVKAATQQLTKVYEQKCSAKNFKGDDEMLIALTVALSGYTDNKESLWSKQTRETNLLSHLTDPYQRAMFKFLAAERHYEDATNTYSDILEDKQLLLEDRVAFACRFLPDIQLMTYVDSLLGREVQEGNIRAIVLTGVTEHIVDLMQSYIDRTSDVQTVCMTLSLTKKYGIMQGEKFNALHDNILYNYLQYFDMKGMWIQRAQFENQRKQMLKNAVSVPPHLTVRCNVCSKSISVGQRNYSDRQRGPKLTKQEDKIADKRFCPHNSCNSLLPRCSLCMYNLGTNSKHHFLTKVHGRASVSQKSTTETKNNPVNVWFVWCLHCQHGGHASHLNMWFMEHSNCPVPDCKCKCRDLDTSPSLERINT